MSFIPPFIDLNNYKIMKIILTILLLVLPTCFLGQQNVNNSIEKDIFYSELINSIENKIISKNIFNNVIYLYRQNEATPISISQKCFIQKEWKKILEYYKCTDFIVQKDKYCPNKYAIFNHCYRHEIIKNDQDRLIEVREIIVKQDGEVECLESRRIPCD